MTPARTARKLLTRPSPAAARSQPAAGGPSASALTSAAVVRGRRTIGICCEYDALPGIGHACGHNLIAEATVAGFLGAKSALESAGGEASGKLVIIGEPGTLQTAFLAGLRRSYPRRCGVQGLRRRRGAAGRLSSSSAAASKTGIPA